jgi:hypothetical protein
MSMTDKELQEGLRKYQSLKQQIGDLKRIPEHETWGAEGDSSGARLELPADLMNNHIVPGRLAKLRAEAAELATRLGITEQL